VTCGGPAGTPFCPRCGARRAADRRYALRGIATARVGFHGTVTPSYDDDVTSAVLVATVWLWIASGLRTAYGDGRVASVLKAVGSSSRSTSIACFCSSRRSG